MRRIARSRGIPETIIGPWECRSIDCREQAVFYAEIETTWKNADRAGRRAIANESWEGHFCYLHLVRVLELKLDEIPYSVPLVIRRIM